MKKSLILGIFLILFTISGCLSQKSNILDFDQSLEKLYIQSNNLFDKYSKYFNFTGILNQGIEVNISSSNSESPLDLFIKSTFSLDSFQQNYNSQTYYNVNLFDRIKKQKIISSGNFFYSDIEYVPYFKLDKFYIDTGTGSIESRFIQTLLGGIINKWIMIDIQDKKNFIQNYIDINYILKDLISLNQCQIFSKIRNTIYKGKRAYKIGLNLQNIKTCINKPFGDYTGIIFEGFLTPLNNNYVLLEIKKLQLPDKKDLFISGEFNNNNFKINIYNTTTKITNSININYDTKHDKITLESQDYNYDINIDKVQDSLKFNGNLSLQTKNVKQTKIKFDIKGNLTLQNTGYLDIKAPQNYIIMSQLLGDKFSLKNIIGQ